jgi:hypothetical protein
VSSKLGTPLPRRSVAWIWFAVAALLTIILARAAFLGNQSWWAPSIFLGIACLIFLEPRLRRREVESLQVDEFGVLRIDGKIREEVAWSELAEIRIITTSGGPFQEDVFFALAASGGKGCLVPHAAAVRTKLLEELQKRFPGMDDKMIIDAMSCTSSNSFLVWKRAA